MKHTHKQKIETLRKILKEYSKYRIRSYTCFSFKLKPVVSNQNCLENKYKPYKHNELTFCLYRLRKKAFNGYRQRFPIKPFVKDIDKVIARYSSKLSYEEKKHELKYNLEDAIKELEFKNKFKSIMK